MSRTSLIIEIIIFFLMIFKSGVLQNKKNVQKLIIYQDIEHYSTGKRKMQGEKKRNCQ